MYKVILADDHAIVMAGLELVLESDSSVQVIGKAKSGKGVLDLLKSGLQPNIIISDFFMPEMGGLDLLKELPASFKHLKILIMSSDQSVEIIASVMKHGAAGFIDKNIDMDELLFAVKQVAQGKKYLSGEHWLNLIGNTEKLMLRKERESPLFPKLNEREIAVLTLLGEGMSNQEISDKLFMSSRTVEGYRKRILDKTSSKNTASLIKYAINNNIIL